MKAAQIKAPRSIHLIEIDDPVLSDCPTDHIIVQLRRACLCGSDAPFFTYDLTHVRVEPLEQLTMDSEHLDLGGNEVYPLRPGQSLHECAGDVIASGSTKFKEGDFVLVLPEFQNGYQERILIPASRAVHLPKNSVSIEEMVLSQPLGTVIWACRKLKNVLGANVVVVGLGPIGLLFSHIMANLGARRVIGLDRIPSRLETAKKMHATHSINVDETDPSAAVMDITNGKNADIVVDAVGHQVYLMDLCVKLVKSHGTILYFGVPDRDHYPHFPHIEFFRKNLRLVSSVGPEIHYDYPLARDLIAQGRINVKPLVTHVLPFTDPQGAYEIFTERKDRAIKVFINFEKKTNAG
jgi:threonine dehydrogenase-like Zn-dependent dehydrogenase